MKTKRYGASVWAVALTALLASCATPQPDPPAPVAIAAPAPVSPAPPPPAPEVPSLTAEVLAKVPEAYRAAFGQLKLADAQVEQLKSQSPQRVFEFLSEQIVRQKTDGAAQLA